MTRRVSPRRPARGLTLLELLLALAATGLIGLAVAALSVSVAYGTADRNDVRGLVIRHKTLDQRLAAALRSAKMVLAAGPDYLVLWTADTRANDAPNLSELRRIERDASGRLWSYQAAFPATWTQTQIDATDITYPLSSDFAAITAALKGSATFPGTQWASGVTAWTVAANDPDPHAATLVTYRATVTLAGDLPRTETVVGAAALRNGTEGN